jgi:altronate hydrolase
MKKTKNAIKIHDSDNVAVVLENIKSGESVFEIKAENNIPPGHKIALSHISKNENAIKYGSPIGRATKDIKQGEHVHTHNIKTNLSGIVEYSYNPETPIAARSSAATFKGYKRLDGKVGIRNEIWIINTVGCVNKIAEKIVQLANLENLFTFVHPFGCSQLGSDHKFTQQILKNLVNHPNAAGVLVLGLGCENNHINEFKQVLGMWDENRVKFLNTQDVTDEIAEGINLVNELAAYANTFERTDIPVSELVLGLKCGGSDGFSGITANALVGNLSDYIIAHGGACVLTEVPEMFGAETLLMNRAKDENIFGKTVELINNFKNYFIAHNQEIYENPSPGNKEGGISTLEEKSLGCTQKGGGSQVTDVLDYGGTVKKPGLNLLQGPGNDIVAVTNLAAAGAHIVLFTTGRGTPLGGPVPTVKISSNTALAENKSHWIDFDAGELLSGTHMNELTERFFNYLIELASGLVLAKNEQNNYREISIFKNGVTL